MSGTEPTNSENTGEANEGSTGSPPKGSPVASNRSSRRLSRGSKRYSRDYSTLADETSEHFYDMEECAAFTTHIVNCVGDDPLLARHFPVNPMSEEIFARMADGLILTKFINHNFPNTIDEARLHKGEDPSIFQKQKI